MEVKSTVQCIIYLLKPIIDNNFRIFCQGSSKINSWVLLMVSGVLTTRFFTWVFITGICYHHITREHSLYFYHKHHHKQLIWIPKEQNDFRQIRTPLIIAALRLHSALGFHIATVSRLLLFITCVRLFLMPKLSESGILWWESNW